MILIHLWRVKVTEISKLKLRNQDLKQLILTISKMIKYPKKKWYDNNAEIYI